MSRSNKRFYNCYIKESLTEVYPLPCVLLSIPHLDMMTTRLQNIIHVVFVYKTERPQPKTYRIFKGDTFVACDLYGVTQIELRVEDKVSRIVHREAAWVKQRKVLSAYSMKL